MAQLTGRIIAAGGPILSSSASVKHELGASVQDGYGRVYRYAKAGVLLVVGDVLQSPAVIAAHVDMAPTVTAAGATTINVTPAGTAGAENLYAGGTAVISTGPGGGYSYGIRSHAAITASTAFDLGLDYSNPIQVALSTASRVDLRHNPYNGVIQAPITTLTGSVAGVAVYPIPSGEYGWIQTWGPCGVLITGTPGVGLRVVSPSGVAGAAAVDAATAAENVIGTMMAVGVTGKWKNVFLTIAP